jgi:hypothetical protein
MALRQPLLSPLGAPLVIQVEGYPALLGLTALFVLLSVPVGGLFWALAGRAVDRQKTIRRSLLRTWVRAMGVAGLITLGGGLVLLFLVAPALMAVMAVGSVIPAASILFVCMLSLSFCGMVWLTMVFLFSVHGAVLYEDRIWTAIWNGIDVLRVGPTSTLLAILSYFLLYMLSVNIWALPAESDWAGLLAVLGNAYLSSVLVSASLTYYDDKRRWIGEMRALRAAHPAAPPPAANTL